MNMMNEFRKMGGCKIVKFLKGEEQDLVGNSLMGESIKLLENQSDMVNRRTSGEDVGRGILDQLKFIEKCMVKNKEDGITIINTGCKQGTDENSGVVGCEEQARMIYITEVEVGRPGDVSDVAFKQYKVLSRMTSRLLTLGGEGTC